MMTELLGGHYPELEIQNLPVLHTASYFYRMAD